MPDGNCKRGMYNIGDLIRCYGRIGRISGYHVEAVKNQLFYEVIFDDDEHFPYMVTEKEIEKITEPITNTSRLFTNYTKFYNLEASLIAKRRKSLLEYPKEQAQNSNQIPCGITINSGKLYFNEIEEEYKMSRNWIKKVIFNDPATIILWQNNDKTVVKCGKHDIYDPEKGLAMAITKYALGNKGNYYGLFDKYLPEDYKKSKTKNDVEALLIRSKINDKNCTNYDVKDND